MLKICDRCGAEISRDRPMRIMDALYESPVDLCKTCEEEFKKFMNQGAGE